MKRVSLVFFLIFLFLLNVLIAQKAKQYSFKHFTTLNGLVSNSVNSVAQDKEGYIWFATTNGLQRYDGNVFLNFTASERNPKSIPSTNIVTLLVDKKGRLWVVGDENSVGVFDTKKFEFKRASLPKDVIPNSYQRFIELPNGNILLLTSTGTLCIYSENINGFVPANQVFQFPKNWKIKHLTWDKSIQKFWISADSGLIQLNPVNKNILYRGNNSLNDPIIKAFENDRFLTDFGLDNSGNVFAVLQERSSIPPKIRYFNKNTRENRITDLNKDLGIKHIHTSGFLMQQNGRLWIYGMPYLAEWVKDRNNFVKVATGERGHQNIYFNRVYQALEDRENNIWVASDNGVLLFNPDMQVFSSFDLLRPGEPISHELVQALAETGDGRILVGTWRGGLYVYDMELNPLPLPASYQSKGRSMSVADMGMHNKTGNIWITQEEGKIDVFNPRTNSVIEVADTIFKRTTIRQITNDTSGNVWLGTQSGHLIKWNYKTSGGNPKKGYEVIYQAGAVIRKVHFDYGGYIWIGTANNGLIKIDTRTNKPVKIFTVIGPIGERLFSNAIKDITYYNDSTLLVAAGCLNIVNKKTNKISFISTADGLPSNTLESVQRDKNNTVWMGMTNGISRLNFEKKIISYYDRRDGISYDNFMQTGVQQISDHRLFFFTDHNFMSFDPDKVSPKQLPPRPYITSFKLGVKPLSLDSLFSEKGVELNYTNTSFRIDFSAMSFLQQRKLHYYYKLDGLENEWIHTDRPSGVVYNYLPPGKYTFYVKTQTIDGISNEVMAKLNIVVLAPFWKTGWFYSIIVLLLLAIWYFIDRERINKRKSLLHVRSEIANNLHDDISITLNDINVLSEMARIKAGKNVEQSKDFIAQISEKSSNMIVAMDDMLWSINPANDSMKNTLQRIKELTSGLQVAYNVDIELIIDNKLEENNMEMKLRHDFYFLYKDAITFFVRNDSINQVFVNLKDKKSHLLIEIFSNCPANLGDFESNFKRVMHKRMQQLPNNLTFTSDPKQVLAVFRIPLN